MVSIEISILKSLLFNEDYARRVHPYLEERYFDGQYKTFFKVYKDLFDKYNSIPTIEALAISFQKTNLQESEFKEIVQIVEDIEKSRKDIPDTDWLIDETEQYCRDKAIFDAMYKAMGIIEGTDKKLDKFAIPDILEEALSVCFDMTIGMDYFEDAERRYDMYTAEDARLQYPLDALNLLTSGGHKKKALSCILATTNTGKSALMCYLAGEWLKRGKNVLYITMEMSEEDVTERIDANVLDCKTDDLKKMTKQSFLSKVEEIKKKTLGKLVVKEYPTGSGSAAHFKALCKELKQKKKFVPDIIFVDYINICASSRYKNMGGVNSYSYIKAIAEELRGLAMELDTCMMTGTQINREGSKSQTPGMEATSDSFGLPMSLDFFFAAVADQVMLDNNQQLWIPLKTRWGNKSKLKSQLVGVDFDKMRYYDLDSSRSTIEAAKETTMKDRLKQKLSEGTTTDIEWD